MPKTKKKINSIVFAKMQCYLLLAFLLVTITTKAQKPYDCSYCNLSGKDFTGQNLTDVNFSGAILDGVNFTNCKLNGAMFCNASLTNANFTNAKLDPSSSGPSNFSGANLTNANFTSASLKGTILEYANLSNTDFTGADLRGSLPGLYLLLSAGNTMPKFKRAKIGCEYRQFQSEIDLTSALFECSELNTTLSSPNITSQLIEQSNDRTQPNKVLVTYVEEDSTSENKKVRDSTIAQKTGAEKRLLFRNDTIYVSVIGTDTTGCGSIDNPCNTIAQGVNIANANGTIYVDYGQYPLTGTITISKALTIIGGCSSGVPTRYQSQVTAPTDGAPAFNITGNGVSVNIFNFIFNGSEGTQNRASTVGQVIAATLKIKNTNINAAKGGQGAGGGQPQAGAKGGDGGDGKNGTGGTPGPSACGAYNSGGGGANQSTRATMACKCGGIFCFTCTPESTIHTSDGGSGQPGTTGVWAAGSRNAGGIGYVCPRTRRPAAAGPGINGTAARCGSAGVAATNTVGSFSTGQQWQPSVAGNGISGGNGGGGGGGGAGGTCHYCNCACSGNGSFYNGTAGGGGGAGGCGASGGMGGMQGGASFGLVLQAATCIADNSVKITSGAGGNGGNGGAGNSGGIGGKGGNAQAARNVCNSTGSQGGKGGDGGAGGASGGGAGGNGGPAIGIGLVGKCNISGVPVYYMGQSGNTGAGGAGGMQGTGGTCSGTTGNNGNKGTVANTYQF